MTKQQIVKFLELVPVVGFGLAYWRYDLQMATLVLMVLMTVFVVVTKLLGEHLTKVQLATWLVIVVLGVATLAFQDERFIKWKTTVINAALSMVLLLSHLVGERTIVERFLAEKIKAPIRMLRRVNFAAGLHLLMIAGLNLLFAYHFETTVWVNFKLFGIFALNFLFLVGSLLYLRDYLKDYMASLENGQR